MTPPSHRIGIKESFIQPLQNLLEGNFLSSCCYFHSDPISRNTNSVKVCDSKLTVSIESKPLKTVPCFDPQIPPTAPIPTFPAFPGQSGITPPGFIPGMLTTDSPLGSGSGSGSSLPWPTSYPQWLTTADQEDMFSEVDGVLVFGKSDRFVLSRFVFVYF